MDTGRLINKLSNCLRRRSAETQKRIHISGTKGQILNYILIESQKRPLVQRDVEQEFGLRPSTATEMLQALQAADLIRREPDPADAQMCIRDRRHTGRTAGEYRCGHLRPAYAA